MFMRLLLLSILAALSLAGPQKKISFVENSGSWVYMYDESGHKYKTLSESSVGEVKGFSSDFFVTQKGSWIYLFDANGRKYKTMSQSSVGDVIGVSGNTFTSRKGSWIYTWDKDGRKINTRTAR